MKYAIVRWTKKGNPKPVKGFDGRWLTYEDRREADKDAYKMDAYIKASTGLINTTTVISLEGLQE